MVIFYVYMRERVKKSPFYVAYTQIGNLRIGNLTSQTVLRVYAYLFIGEFSIAKIDHKKPIPRL